MTQTGSGGPSLVRRAWAYELGMWRSLFAWLLRRPAVRSPGAEAFGYLGPVRPMLTVLIVLSAVEIPILDLILSRTVPWRPVRYLALVLGGYGLLWMIGLFAAMRVNPHVVDDSGLRIRSGTTVDLTVPWEAVQAVQSRYRSLDSSRTVQVEHAGPAAVLSVATAGQTSVDVTLHQPTVIALPNGAREPVTAVRFYADDSDSLAASARRRLTAALPDGRA